MSITREVQTDPIRLREKALAARACLIRAMELEEGTEVSEDAKLEAGCLYWAARDALTELDLGLQALVRETV